MALSDTTRDNIARAAEFLDGVSRIFFITGAGVSADSGLPTYRGIGGLYEDQTTDEGIPIEAAISGEMMASRPEIAWKYLAGIENACRGAGPNRAHEIMAEMETHFDEVWILTQNIDGFHHAAGSSNIIDIHGNFADLYCVECGKRSRVPDYMELGDLPPVCDSCGGLVRPDVVLFGEQLPVEKCDTLMREWNTGFDIVFSVGTTSVFPYIAQPVHFANHHGIPTIEINPGETSVSHVVDVKIEAGAAETLEELWRLYRGET